MIHVRINTVVPIIVILEIDMEVSDKSMKTVEFDNCREVSEDNRDINRILAARESKIFL